MLASLYIMYNKSEYIKILTIKVHLKLEKQNETIYHRHVFFNSNINIVYVISCATNNRKLVISSW